METHRIHLEVFEGPLDLLLHLIKKEDVDIYDIPISKVLHQYLEYLDLAKDLNIDLAGEFIEMASELAYIKSKMLLPEPETEAEEGTDPRADLVARLLEYQRYKMAAQSLLERPLLGRDVFSRPPSETGADAVDPEMEADTLALLTAFQKLLKRLPKDQYHEVRQIRMGVAERILELTEFLKGKDQVVFEDLFTGVASRGELIVTFLALLEMAKQRLVKVHQEAVRHQIFIRPLLLEEGKESHASQNYS